MFSLRLGGLCVLARKRHRKFLAKTQRPQRRKETKTGLFYDCPADAEQFRVSFNHRHEIVLAVPRNHVLIDGHVLQIPEALLVAFAIMIVLPSRAPRTRYDP